MHRQNSDRPPCTPEEGEIVSSFNGFTLAVASASLFSQPAHLRPPLHHSQSFPLYSRCRSRLSNSLTRNKRCCLAASICCFSSEVVKYGGWRSRKERCLYCILSYYYHKVLLWNLAYICSISGLRLIKFATPSLTTCQVCPPTSLLAFFAPSPPMFHCCCVCCPLLLWMGVTRAVCSRAIESNVKVIGEIVSFSKFNSHRVRPVCTLLPSEQDSWDRDTLFQWTL